MIELSDNRDYSTKTYLAQQQENKNWLILKIIKATDKQAEQVKREIDCLSQHNLLINYTEENISETRGSALEKQKLTKKFSIEIKYISGVSLDKFFQKNPDLTAKQLLSIVYQMARAVDSFHNSCWVHRDLKPDNFLITKEGIKLIDFGHAVKLEEAKKYFSLGNYSFSAPESSDEETAINDQQSDSHAFGKSILNLLGCFSPLPYFAPELDFNKKIPAQLAESRLPFDEEQRQLVHEITSRLCQPIHGERLTAKDVYELLETQITDIDDLSWLNDEAIVFTPPDKTAVKHEAPSVSQFGMFRESEDETLSATGNIGMPHYS